MNYRTLIRSFIKHIFKPLVPLYRYCRRQYGKRHMKWLITETYRMELGKELNWDNPRNLNEKINWLKLHEDPFIWALLADKFRVREYVKKRGLEDILIPLYGQWNKAEEVIDNWDSLPDEFVLKCNNGNGKVLIISQETGGKKSIDLSELQKKLDKWVKKEYSGICGAEPHYSLIDNCIIAEELLKDDSKPCVSNSIIDYKIWCFDGIPYGCLVCYDRDLKTKVFKRAFYDVDWVEHPEMLSSEAEKQSIDKPKEWENMLDIARILSKGHPQVRVDLYYVKDKVYFGEMTMTAKGGFMTSFTDKALLDMGNRIQLDLSMNSNIFDTFRG